MNQSDLSSTAPAGDESLELYRLIAESMPLMVWTAGADGSALSCNGRLCAYTGLGARELRGWGWLGALHPDDRARVEQRWRHTLATGDSYEEEIRLRRHDGAYRWHLDTASPLKDASGRIAGWIGLCTDIDDRKRASELLEARVAERTRSLRESEARFRGLADLSADWYWEQDQSFRFTFFSLVVSERAGSFVRSNLGKTRWELPTVGVSAAEWTAHRATLDAHQPFHDFEFQLVDESGETIWLSSSGAPVFDDTGDFRGYRGVGRNITQRKGAEKALFESERRFQLFMDHSPALAWIKDSNLRYVYINSAHQATHGMPRERMLGRDDFEIWPEPVARMFRAADEAALASNEPIVLPDMVPAAEGSERHFLVVKFRTPDSSGRNGVAGMAMDVTARVALERELKQSSDRVRMLLRRLTEVQEAERHRIAAELHDVIGQNLTALGIGLETLRGILPPERARPNAATFEDMARLIDNTMSTVRETILELRPALLDDFGLLAALQSHGRNFAHRTGLAVTVEGEAIEPRPAPKIELALFRIAQEALVNVAKHAKASRARIVLTRKGGFVHLAIEDDGAGFAQPSAARAAHSGGWGLPMMRERAEEAGGSLRIEFPGRGTRVIAEVPHVDPHRPG